MAYKEYETGSSFETYTRRGFIKACHILAKGLSFPSDRPLIIGITGSMNVGKALVADAFINALDEHPKTKKYDMPPSPKMAFEAEPAQAAHFPVKGGLQYDGDRLPVHFVRQIDDVEYVRKRTGRGLIFYSADRRTFASDLQVDVQGPSVNSVELLRTNWDRKWTVSVMTGALYNEKMDAMLSHLNQMHANQLYRKSFDI